LDDNWQRTWANKLPANPEPLVEEILAAAHDHAEHHGVDPPDLIPPRD